MKKFKFRLERVLDFRNVEKKEKERELSQRNYELRQREDELETIIESQDRAKIPTETVVTMAELALNGRYQQFLRKMLEQQRVLVEQAVEAVDEARNAYLEKAIAAETLETLKERRHDEYSEEKRRFDKKQIDEIVVQRHRLVKRKFGSGGVDE